MQHTAITIMVQHLEMDMIFTLQATQIVTTILTSMVVTLTAVHTVADTCGQEIEISVQMR